MKTNVKQAIVTVETLIKEDALYYSADTTTYYATVNNGMGKFGLYQVHSEWTGLLVGCETVATLEKKVVLGKVNETNLDVTPCQDYSVEMAKVTGIQLYGHQHERTLTSALLFASKHHQHQKRKASGEPYINHILEVLQTLTHFEPECDESTQIAAVLHDVVEDTPVTIESIEFLFGSRVATIVSTLTYVSPDKKNDKKAALLTQIKMASNEAKIIKLADVISNVTSLPQDWSFERKSAYVDWCKKVASECAAGSVNLYANFNYLITNNHLISLEEKQQPSWISFSSVESLTPEEINAQLKIDEENESIGKLVVQMDRETMSMPIDIVTTPNIVKVTTNLRHQLSVLLPSNVIADLDLNEGDEVEFCVGDAIITFYKI